ncbi:ribokinase [Veronia nyctiphanis]|uniref:Ribokinase n=1 Tax=Veronia nyctiphanis TaxID=1278244 RepID=A0A4Q0YRZ3_9GAMM|nr:ribokinase [Veronia nyctiphanis]RXJ73980.1 ribokinase [Veronia nyctiphanis]
MNELVVLGSVNADHVLKIPSFPRPGETLTGSGYRVIPGGKGANQAVAAARMGADVAFIACVGDDDFGHSMKKAYSELGINTDGVMTVANCPTGIAMIHVVDSGENCICLSPEANAALTNDALAPRLSMIEGAKVLLMQLETPMETVKLAAETAQKSQTTVVLNPAPAIELDDSMLSLIDIITPNETEAEVLTGIRVECENSAQKASDVLHQKGVNTVMITLGNKGAWLSEQGKNGRIIDGFRVRPLDTTAAGDTFNGAFVTELIKGSSVDSAVIIAHAAAAISVTREGAQTSIPEKQDVDAFLDTHSLQQ